MANVGDRFYRLTFVGIGIPEITTIEQGYLRNRKRTRWICRCDCGNEILVYPERLKRGSVKSCGCYRREYSRDLGYKNTKHGHYTDDKPTLYYSTWHSMINRCKHKSCSNYEYYGGRGIKVSEEFSNFLPFYNYVIKNLGPRPTGGSLDRINTNGNYERGNLRWATAKEQANNRRNSICL